jgi:hypothetical protein
MDVFQYILGAGSCLARVKFHYNLRAIGKLFLFGRGLMFTTNKKYLFGSGIQLAFQSGMQHKNKWSMNQKQYKLIL